MTSATRELHLTLLRHLEGCLKAWRKWLEQQPGA
jgi:hypothetical protein